MSEVIHGDELPDGTIVESETMMDKVARRSPSVKVAPKIEVRKIPEPVAVAKPAVKPKPLPWWKSPAGWVRKGQEQALSYNSTDDLEEFKYKVAKRIPTGPHLEALTPIYRSMVEEDVRKYEKKEDE